MKAVGVVGGLLLASGMALADPYSSTPNNTNEVRIDIEGTLIVQSCSVNVDQTVTLPEISSVRGSETEFRPLGFTFEQCPPDMQTIKAKVSAQGTPLPSGNFEVLQQGSQTTAQNLELELRWKQNDPSKVVKNGQEEDIAVNGGTADKQNLLYGRFIVRGDDSPYTGAVVAPVNVQITMP